jgi:exopolysaccharide biosynthesis polyprenyl glycosylphosphotransferase
MISSRKETFFLMLGDVLCFYIALFAALFIRYQDIPNGRLLSIHLMPFTILFAIWILVFFIAGLYEKQTILLKKRLPGVIFNSQIANSILAALFFYALPGFQIAPKTNLFLVLALSFILIVYWRKRSQSLFVARKRESALLIASGSEMRELEREVSANPRYSFDFASAIDLDSVESVDVWHEIAKRISSRQYGMIVADFTSDKLMPLLPDLYHLLFTNVRFVEMHGLYEDIFNKIPLSLVRHSWFLENVSTEPKQIYDALKRGMDVMLALILMVVTSPFYIAVWIAIKLDDRGPIFIVQERVGKGGVPIRIVKFRSMTMNDQGIYDSAKNNGEGANAVTRVGGFLRRSRIDELPQLWNVLRGDLSLIGPRPELPALAAAYEKEIPYYNVRHLLKPGLSGWAQLYHDNHPHHEEAVQATREKLSYDLYYVKNRSFLLDLKIALRTVQTLLSRSGR